MEKLFTMDALVSIVVIGYCLWSLYSSTKQFMINNRLFKEYKANHKNYDELDTSKKYLALYAILFVVCIALMIHPHVKADQVYFTRVALGCIALIAIALSLDTIVKRRIIFDDKGFVYEKAYYHYRLVSNVTYEKGFMKNTEIASLEVKRIMISRQMGEVFKKHYMEWKNRKKKK